MTKKALASLPVWIALHVAAVLLVVLVTWPWALHFDGELIRHWDPPFHAWKLEFMARHILAGDPFFLDRETTLLYPHAGTLYFEALQWPASVLGALLFAATDWSPTLVYHAVMLFMWGLSAPCMFLFLRKTGASGAVAAAVSLAFCVLPYRISYVNEFQMQFAFGTPLFFWAVLSFLETPGPRRGVAVAAVAWLYAVTELNQAVFVVFALPFVAVSFLSARPDLLRNRRFWTGAAAAAVAGLALLPVLLWPYAQQHLAGAVVRDLAEIDRHSVQVFSFLRPFGRFYPWTFPAKTEEWQAYPTIALALLSAAGTAVLARDSFRDGTRPAWRRFAPLPAIALVAAFAALSAAFQCSAGISVRPLVRLWGLLPVACAAAALWACLSAGGDKPERRMLVALPAAAVLCAFLTTGPFLGLTLGGRTFAEPNRLYMALYRHGPFLSGFRAACRFGTVVHFAMLVMAAFALDRALARLRAARSLPSAAKKPAGWLAGAAFVAAVAVEAIPPAKTVATERVDDPDKWPVVAGLADRSEPFTLAVFPMGSRSQDAQTMFGLLKDRYNSFYAWCGYVPPETEAVRQSVTSGDYARACSELSALWPDCLLLVDSAKPTRAKPGYAKAFPSHVFRRKKDWFVDYAAALAPFARVLGRDGRFALLELDRSAPAAQFVKRFRSDFGRRLPEAVFSIAASDASEAAVSLNGGPPETFRIDPGKPDEIRFPVPADRLVSSGFNEIRISFDAPVRLDGFELRKPDSAP